MLDQKGTVINAKFYPKDSELSDLERQCIQSNKEFCEIYDIILNLGVFSHGEQSNKNF